MFSRGGLGILSAIALLITIGLVLTHSQEASQIGSTVFSGVDILIRDLELAPNRVKGAVH